MKTNKKLKYLRNEAIEEITSKRLKEYETYCDAKLSFPVPVEMIAEQIFDLTFDWDIIEEAPDEQILAGLIPKKKKIVMNESHLDLFNKKPGLERSTTGHEIGHWDIDIDHSKLNHPSLQNLDFESSITFRNTKKSDTLVRVLKYAMSNNQAYQVYKELNRGKDSPEVKSAVDRYQSALLMPKWLVLEALDRYDRTHWPDLYSFAEEANVNISNLTVRLQRLGLIFIPEGSKKIFKSVHHYSGQNELF